MSDGLFDFLGDPWERVRGRAAELLAGGEAEVVADAVLAELTGREPWRRSAALERLAELEGAEAMMPRLESALRDATHADRRNAARSALGVLASPASAACESAIEALATLAGADSDADVRLLATIALGESGNARGRAKLEAILTDADANVAAAAAESLGMIGDRRAVPALVEAGGRGPLWVRLASILALGRLRDERALEALGKWVGEPELSGAVAAAIGDIGKVGGLPLLRPALELGGEARAVAKTAVARIYAADPEAEVPAWLRSEMAPDVAELMSRLEEGDEDAARLLGIAGTAEAADALVDLLDNPDGVTLGTLGLQRLPAGPRTRLALERLEGRSAEGRGALLHALPPLTDPQTIRAVVAHLADADARVRNAAAEVLGRSNPQLVAEALEEAAAEPSMRVGVAMAYGQLGAARCEPLLHLLRDPEPQVRETAARALGRCPQPDAGEVGGALRVETDPSVREAMIGALGAIGGPAAVDLLQAFITDDLLATRYAAVRALGATGAAEALEPLLRALSDPSADVRVAALIALGELGDPRASRVVEDWMKEGATDVRRTAAHALDRLARPGAWSAVAEALNDTDPQVRVTAAETLRRVGDTEALDALRRRADTEPSPAVREAVTRAIVELQESRDVRAAE